MKLMRYFVTFIIFGVIFIFLWRGLTIDPRTIPSPLMNKSLPIFNMSTVVNPKVHFSNSDLQGQVCLINVWATWCSTCRAEHPFLMDLVRNNHIAVYGIDYKDDLSAAQQFLATYGNPYRLLGFDADGKASIDLGVYGTPETFLLDKKGIIRYKLIGQLTPEIWQQKLLPLVQELNKQR